MEVNLFKGNEQERPKATVGLDAERLGFKLALQLVFGFAQDLPGELLSDGLLAVFIYDMAVSSFLGATCVRVATPSSFSRAAIRSSMYLLRPSASSGNSLTAAPNAEDTSGAAIATGPLKTWLINLSCSTAHTSLACVATSKFNVLAIRAMVSG